MEFAQDLVGCAPRTVVQSAGVACWGDLRVGRRAGAERLKVPILLLEHPVFGAVRGISAPVSLLDQQQE